MAGSSTMASAAMAALRRPTAHTSTTTTAKIAATHLIRHYATKKSIVRELDRASKRGASKATKEQTMSQMQRAANAEYFKGGGGPLFPGTFVSQPLSLVPRNPADFLSYQWWRLKQWGLATVSILNFKLSSMPNWTTRPKWKARRGKIAPTAKAMYREMLEAFAAGDQAAITRLCLPEFARKLNSAIERRDPRQQVDFELVKYTGGLFYPRLMSHQIHQVNPQDKTLVNEQAVVGISSRQQVSRKDATTGAVIQGSLRIQDKIEYVVLSRQASAKTFVAEPWRIWGTTSATTMESYLEEQRVIDKEQAKRAGWKPSEKKKKKLE